MSLSRVRPLDCVVIGAGAAGLATSQALSAAGISHVVLERGSTVGHTWANSYDSLVLHTARRLSTLRGLDYPEGTPRFPTRNDVVAYLARYAARSNAPVESGVDVMSLTRHGDAWTATTATGDAFRTRSAVVATGIAANPVRPDLPGLSAFRGDVLHSVDYRRPDRFAGRRVLVVGAGNSAGEIAAELAQSGIEVVLAVRSGAAIVPREVAGVPLQYLALGVAILPKALQPAVLGGFGRLAALVHGPPPLPPPPPRPTCPRVPLIGLALAEALRAGAIALRREPDSVTADAVRFADGREERLDAVIFATGFRAAIGLLGDAVTRDACGFARRTDLVTSADRPGLFFVGHNYGLRGGLLNISRDGPLAARGVARYLAAR